MPPAFMQQQEVGCKKQDTTGVPRTTPNTDSSFLSLPYSKGAKTGSMIDTGSSYFLSPTSGIAGKRRYQ